MELVDSIDKDVVVSSSILGVKDTCFKSNEIAGYICSHNFKLFLVFLAYWVN